MSTVLLVSKKKSTGEHLAESLGSLAPLISCPETARLGELAKVADLVVLDMTDQEVDHTAALRILRESHPDLPLFVYGEEGSPGIPGLHSAGILHAGLSKETVSAVVGKEMRGVEMKRELAYLKEKGQEAQRATRSEILATTSSRSLSHLTSLLNNDIFDGETFLNNFLQIFKEVSRVSRVAAIMKREGAGGVYRVCASAGIEEELVQYLVFSDREGILAHLAQELGVLRKEGAPYKALREFEALKVLYAVPLIGRKGFIGALVFNNRITGGILTDDDLLTYYELASAAGKVLERAQEYNSMYMKRHFAENLLDAVKSGVITFDRKGKLVDMNRTAREIFNVSSADALEIKKGKLPAEFLAMIRETLEGTADVRGREITLGDSHHILEVNAFRITDESGQVVGASFVFDDPHYEKNIEKEARKSERLEFVNKIALRSSHELRNCLVSIRTFTQLLPEKYVDEQFRKDFYSVVSKEVERLNSLVDKLVFFAQPLTLQYGKVNINELVDQSLALVKGNEESTVTVNKNFSHQTPFIEIDREQVVKAFGNIIQNAMQSMQKGGRLVISTKEVVLEGAGRTLIVQFRDTGKGVALQNSDEVFEPFFSTKSRGLGLGLTIARKIIEQHGGMVRFESKKEGGAEVTVCIPREPRLNKNIAVGSVPQSSSHLSS